MKLFAILVAILGILTLTVAARVKCPPPPPPLTCCNCPPPNPFPAECAAVSCLPCPK